MPFLALRLGFHSDAGAEYRTTRVPLGRKLSDLKHVVSSSKLRGHHSPRSDVLAHRVWPAMQEVPESVLSGHDTRQLSFLNDQRENTPSFLRQQNHRLVEKRSAVARFCRTPQWSRSGVRFFRRTGQCLNNAQHRTMVLSAPLSGSSATATLAHLLKVRRNEV